MKQLQDLMQFVLDNGVNQLNKRTNHICRFVAGKQVEFDVSEFFPAVSGKFLPFKSTRGELLGFFRGYTNSADFESIGCKFWHKNANQTQAWLNNPYRKGENDLGPVYGKQWTRWLDRRICSKNETTRLLQDESKGYKYIGRIEESNDEFVIEREINQLENLVRNIIIDPSDRRLIVSGWNVAELDMMALPPCHMDYRFVPCVDQNTMDVVMTIRSWDLFLGAPANIASTSMFLYVVAKLTGYKPNKVVIQATNAHLYDNSFDETVEYINREPMPPCKLVLSDNIKQITDLNDIKGCFERINPDDINLDGYTSHPSIKVEMVE